MLTRWSICISKGSGKPRGSEIYLINYWIFDLTWFDKLYGICTLNLYSHLYLRTLHIVDGTFSATIEMCCSLMLPSLEMPSD